MRGILLTLLLVFTGLNQILAQFLPLAYTGAGTQYVQNFDGLPAAGSFSLTGKGPFSLSSAPLNASGLSGWQIFMIAGSNPTASFAVGTGSSTGNGVYSLGTAASSDRSLGSLSSSTGIYSFGLVLTNQTGGLLNSFTVSFTAEQWRKGGSTVKNIWTCRYKTGIISQLDQTDLIEEPNLNFGSIITTSGGLALNGNLPENRQLITFTVKSINWKPGEQLLIKWDDADEPGSDDAVGIDNFSFSANLLSSAPVINAISSSSITANSAKLTTTVNENFAATSVFFEYDTTNSFATKKIIIGTPDTIKAGMGNTIVNAGLSGLTPGTTFYYRIKASNNNGAVVSGIQNFATAISLPTVTTGDVFSVTTGSAFMGGSVSDLGGATVTEKGIVWSVNNNPTITDNKVLMGNGIGNFSQLINGLPEGTLVYARAYAINSGGIAYGAIVNFTTQTTITQFTSTVASKTNSSTINFLFKTAKNINGLSTNNFAIQASGVSAAAITSITGSGNTYTITVNTGNGDGKLGLVFANDSGISVPILNKPYSTSNPILIDKTAPQIMEITIADKIMLIDDTVNATIRVKPDSDGFKMTNGSIGGFSMFGLTKMNDSLYTASFVINNGGKDIDASSDIAVNLSLADSVGNNSLAYKDSIRQSKDQIDANRPVILSIQNPQKGIYKIGDTLLFIFHWNEKIVVTNIATTSLGITIGTRSRTGTYVSGSGTDSLLFQYVVSSGDQDKDGIKTAGSISTGNGLIKDIAGNNAKTSFSNTLATKEILIDGVAPVITSVTVPTSGVYRTGNLIDFIVNFSKKIFVDETLNAPTLLINIGSKQKKASYISGTGSSSLLFRYSVQMDDVDTNGIKLVSSLIDSSFSIKDSIGNKAVLQLSNIGSMLSVKINPPTTFIESVLVPPSGNYKAGDTLDILITYNERVWVTTEKGIPYLKIMIGNSSKQATFSDGSGGNTLFFSYIVQPGDEDTNGIQLNNFISLNNGTIKNENGYNAPLVLNNVSNTSNLFIDGIAPTIRSIIMPLSGTYKIGDTLDFVFQFSEKINAGATIRSSSLSITIGSKNTIAGYSVGNMSDSLVYRYIIQANDFDKDGIKIISPLLFPNIPLKDLNGNVADIGFSIPSTKNILIDAVLPVANSITVPLPGIYKTGDSINLILNYSKKVYVNSRANPYVSFRIGSKIKNAFFAKGSGTNSLQFSYRVEADDLDTIGIQIVSAVTDFSFMVKDSLGNISTPIDINSKEIKGVYINPPAIIINKFIMPSGGLYKTGDTLQCKVEFSEPVMVYVKNGNPALLLKMNGINKQATYTNGSGTNSLIFKYIIQQGDTDDDGIEIDTMILLNNGSIQNSKLMDASVKINNPSYKNDIFIDAVFPFIKKILLPANKIYKKEDSLDFIFKFSETIFYKNGTPSLPLTIGTKAKTAICISGNGTDSLMFRYYIENGDVDLNGIKMGNLTLNNSTIKDLAGNNASIVFSNPITNGILVDAVSPEIISTSVPLAGIYKTNDTLYFNIGFSKKVFVKPDDKSAHITLQMDNLVREAYYNRGAGSTNLLFSYPIKETDLDTNGISINQLLIDDNKSIKDSAGNTSNLQLNNISKMSGILVNPLPAGITDIIFPKKGLYKTGDTMQFQLIYSENVFVSTKNGTPAILLKLGNIVKKANYISGSGSNILVFKYTIQSGDEDQNGIGVDTVISLNNGSIRNAKLIEALTQIPISIDNEKILIDGIQPFIKQIKSPESGIYKSGDSLDFIFRFSENIYFSNGIPSLPLTIGTKAKNAVYVLGNGTDSLVFSYKILNGDFDADGIKAGNLSLNNSSLRDLAGNNASLLMNTPIVNKGIFVDAVIPVITNVSVPAPGIYKTNDTLHFNIGFSKKIFVTPDDKSAHIILQIGNIVREAYYNRGSGTTNVLFSYPIKETDLDTNGITINQLVIDSSKSLKDSAGNTPNLQLNNVAKISGILINPSPVTINEIIFPIKGLYKIKDTLQFQLIYSDKVFVSTKNGNPSLSLKIGLHEKKAIYTSGTGSNTLLFTYIIQSGDEDRDGIETDSIIFLNDGSIKNSKLMEAITKIPEIKNDIDVLVDGITPILKEISYPSNGIYKSGDTLDFVYTFSEKILFSNGIPSLPITIGTKVKTAVYVSGNGTDSLLFRYQLVNGDIDLDGIKISSLLLNNTIIKDLAGNMYSASTTNSLNAREILVDATPPVVNSIIPPSAGNYRTGDTLNFRIGFSEKIWIKENLKLPTINFQLGSKVKELAYTNGSGSNSLLFSYRIQTEDLDTNGIKLVTFLTDVNNQITDTAGNISTLALNNTNYTGIKINPPIISFIKQVQFPSGGIYKAGDSLWFGCQFNDVVYIKATNSIPFIKCTIGSSSKQAKYIRGSGSENLYFLYVIQTGDIDKDGITINNSITLNGADVINEQGNTSLLNFNTPSVKNIFVDGVKPVITAISSPNSNVYKTGNILDFLISFSEKVYVNSQETFPSLLLNIGTKVRNAIYINGSGSNTLLFRYIVQVDDIANEGIKLDLPFFNKENVIKDSAGNLAILTLSAIPNTSGIIINPVLVTLHSIITPSDKIYRSNDTIEVILNYSEPVFVNTNNGIPSLKIFIGNNTKQALFESGSGTNYLLFRYLIQNGDLDTDGIKLAGNISLNNGFIKDARGNNAPIILPESSSISNVKIDAVSPVIIKINSTSRGFYKSGDTLDFQVSFSEPVYLSNKEDTIKLSINIGNFSKNIKYYQGTGTDKLSFQYIIQTGDLDKNGITIGNSINMSNNVLKDMAGNNAITSLKSNTVFKDILIDAVSPVFVSSKIDTIELCENSNAIKINSVLSVSDNESSELIEWKIKNDPLHGILSDRSVIANSNGKTVSCPLITYKPLDQHSGTDSLLIEVSDGINVSQKKIIFIIQPAIRNNTIGYPQTICIEQKPGLITGSSPSGGNGLYKFIWEFSSGIDSAKFNSASGNNKSAQYAPSLLLQDNWFRRTIQSGACNDTSNSIKITVLKNGVWTGNSSSDWSNSSNWCNNSIPNKSMDVLINSNTLFQPQIRDTVWCNQLILSNNTQLKIDGVLNIQQSIQALENTINAENGTIIFSSIAPQNVSGKLFENKKIQNLVIQNPSEVSITDSLIIKGTVILQSGTLNTNNKLTLQQYASFGPSALGTSVNGTVIAEHTIEGGRRVFQLLGNPFKEHLPLSILKDSIDITGDKGSANGFTNTITNQPSAFWFDPLLGNDSSGIEAGWRPFTHTNGNGENIWPSIHGIRLLMRGKPGQGLDGTPAGNGRNGTYLPEPVTIKLNGNIYYGDVELSLPKNEYPTYQIIANPYLSNIDLSYLTKGKDIAANYWIWNPKQGLHGGYTSFPFRTKYILPSFGAFIAKTNGNLLNSILFTENMKTKENFVNSMDLTDMNEIFHVELRLQTDSIFWDRILLLQMDSAKVFFDRNDAEKLWNSDVNFYSISRDTKMLSIDARPFNNESVIPLGLQTDNPSIFTIKVTKSNLPPTNTLQLHDKYLDKWMLLLYDSSYTFSTTSDTTSYGNERFEIVSIKKQENTLIQSQKLIASVYPVPAKDKINLQFNSAEAGSTTIRLMSISGTVINSMQLGVKKEGQVSIPLGNLINGIYLVEIKCGNETVTQKIIKE